MPDIFEENQPSPPTQEAQQQQPVVSPATESPVEEVEQKAIGLFTTFCKYPRGVSFAEQQDGETVILFLRRDFITNVPWIAATIALGYIPFIIRFIFVSTNFSLFTLPDMLSIPLVSFYYIIVFGF